MAEHVLNTAIEAVKKWHDTDGFDLEALTVESQNLTQALKQKRLDPDVILQLTEEKAKMEKDKTSLRNKRDRLKKLVKRRRKIYRDLKRNVSASQKKEKRSERRLRAEIEEDILQPLGIDATAYHGGDLAGNPIRKRRCSLFAKWTKSNQIDSVQRSYERQEKSEKKDSAQSRT
jgi:hypothetical protein